MMTIEQMRAARAALNISIEDLARLTGLTPAQISAAENGGAMLDQTAASRLESAFQNKGIVFTVKGQSDPGIGPGIRWRGKGSDEGLRPENLSSENDG